MTETHPRPAEPGTATQDTTVRPFRVDIPEEALEDLRRRPGAVRWPSRELVTDRSQGVQLATILDNVTLCWLTRTGGSAARAYWESGQATARAAGQTPPQVSVPVAFSAFPGEIFQAPRSWVQLGYPTLTYYNKPARGGHLAAWEEPQLFSSEVRTAFRSLR